MRSAINALQVRDGHAGVDLGALDTQVSKHFLHIPNVRSIAQHVCRSGVAKSVTGAALTDAGAANAPAYKIRQFAVLDALTCFTEKERFTAGHCRQPAAEFAEILLNRSKCSLRNGNPPILPAFTFANSDDLVLEIHVPDIQPSQLGPAYTGRIVDLNNGSVPPASRDAALKRILAK